MSRTATLVSGVLVLLLALAPAAGAQSGKVVEVDIGGDAVAGSTTTFSLTFTNPAGAQHAGGLGERDDAVHAGRSRRRRQHGPAPQPVARSRVSR